MIHPKVSLLIGISLSASLSLALFYFLRRRLEEKEEEVSYFKKHAQIQMKIPKALVGAIVGREGSVIKSIEAQTNTKIRFSNDDDDESSERIAFIKGSPENIHEAESLIHQIIVDQPQIEEETIVVPARACGRIIGKSGESIRTMCRVSKARISVDSKRPTHDPDAPVKVCLKGTKDQIAMALRLIQEKVEEEESFRNKMAARSSSSGSSTNNLLPIDEPLPSNLKKPSKVPGAAENLHSGQFVEVLISSIVNPSHFFMQVASPAATQLDRMTENMTSFYSVSSNASAHAFPPGNPPKVGTIVAAPFPEDNNWYRAKVLETEVDDYSGKVTLKLVFVDFGDGVDLPIEEVCQLLPQYHSFPHQAIECCLAGIGPVGDDWTDAAYERFSQLTNAPYWKIIVARKVGVNSLGLPLVELIDTNTPEDVNIAKRLVEEGHAKWLHEPSTE